MVLPVTDVTMTMNSSPQRHGYKVGSEGLPILLEPDVNSITRQYGFIHRFREVTHGAWALISGSPGQYLPDFSRSASASALATSHCNHRSDARPVVPHQTRCPTPIYPRRRHEVETASRQRGGDAWVPTNQTARGCRDWIESRLTPPTPTAQAGDASSRRYRDGLGGM